VVVVRDDAAALFAGYQSWWWYATMPPRFSPATSPVAKRRQSDRRRGTRLAATSRNSTHAGNRQNSPHVTMIQSSGNYAPKPDRGSNHASADVRRCRRRTINACTWS